MFEELRQIAIQKRNDTSGERLDRYRRARDDAFDVIVNGSEDKMKTAATEGRFRVPLYSFRLTDADAETEPDTQVYFGSNGEGDRGLHAMTLFNPRGISYDETLIAKLRNHFKASGDENNNDFQVYFQGRARQFAVFVSWDKRKPQMRRPFGVLPPRGGNGTGERSHAPRTRDGWQYQRRGTRPTPRS